jgi:Tol biopolymer transport system component
MLLHNGEAKLQSCHGVTRLILVVPVLVLGLMIACLPSEAWSAGPRSPDSAAQPFDRIAVLISNGYARDGVPANNPDDPRVKQIPTTLHDLESCSDRAVVAAAKQVLAAGKSTKEIQASFDNKVDQVNRWMIQTAAAAARGDYIHTETEETLRYSSDGQRLVSSREVQVNRGMDVLGSSIMMGGLFALYEGIAAQRAIRQEAEAHRLGAWQELLPHMPEYYPRAGVHRELIHVSLVGPDAANQKPGRFTAVNISGERLSRVVLRIDLFHYTSNPQPNVREFYFVPAWEPGQSLQFATNLNPNLAVGTNPNMNALEDLIDYHVPDFRWISGVGGVVQMNLEAWTDQAHQPQKTIRFDDNALRAGMLEYAQACAPVAAALRQASPRSAPQQHRGGLPFETNNGKLFVPKQFDGSAPVGMGPKKLGANSPLVAAGFNNKSLLDRSVEQAMPHIERVLAFAPANSQPLRLAGAFKADPQGAVIKWCRQEVTELNQSIQQHPRYVKSLAAVGTTPTRCAVLMSLNPSDADGQNVSATLSMADRLSDTVRFTGDIRADDRNHLVIRLWPAVVVAGAARPPQLNPRDSAGFDLNNLSNLTLSPNRDGFDMEAADGKRFGETYRIYFATAAKQVAAKPKSLVGHAATNVYFIEHKLKQQPGGEPVTVDQLVRADAEGTPRVLSEGKFGSMRAVTVAADGTVLLFQDSNSPFTERLSADHPRIQRMSNPARPKYPGSSGTGGSEEPDVKPRIEIFSVDGALRRTVDMSTIGGSVIGSPVLLPDGRHIGFTFCESAKPTEAAYEKPSAPRGGRPVGRRSDVSFATRASGISSPPIVAVVDLDGRNLTKIGPGALPRWSPDGKTIIFSAITMEDAGTGSEIIMRWTRSRLSRMDADGRNARTLVNEGSFDGVYSPDGSRITFVSTQAGIGSTATIKVCNADGTDAQPACLIADANCTTPRWISSGIAFERRRYFLKQSGAVDGENCVWAIAPDGGTLHRVSQDSGAGTSSGIDLDAQWIAMKLTEHAEAPPNVNNPNLKSVPAGSKIVFEGTKVFIRDSSGNRTPAPDGDYSVMNGYIIHVRGGEKWIN